MTQVTYTQADGKQIVVQSNTQENLMKLAVENGVQGIIGACGGSCMCATCHVRIDQVDGVLAPANDMEQEIIEMESDNPLPESRLGCQVYTSSDIDAIKVTVMGS